MGFELDSQPDGSSNAFEKTIMKGLGTTISEVTPASCDPIRLGSSSVSDSCTDSNEQSIIDSCVVDLAR